MTEKERYNHGTQHLTTKSEKPQEDDIERDSYPCPTCRKEFLTDKALSHHRTMKQLCRIQWQKDKQTQKTCPYTRCQKRFLTKQQLKMHIEQHGQKQIIADTLYTLDPAGPIDRRRMIYQGKQNTTQQTTKAPITYIEDEKWRCQICGRREAEQDKQNLIVHACKRKTASFPKIIHKIPKTTCTQTDLMQTRIRTLNNEPQILDRQAQQDNELDTKNPTTPTITNDKNAMQTTEPEQTIWQKIQYVTQNTKNQITTWKCQIGPFAHENKTSPGAMRHIAQQHKESRIPARAKVQCPYCSKHYTNLIAIILHLELQKPPENGHRAYVP